LLFLFLDNIKVKFVEHNEVGQEVWCGWGKFTESDVHHQYAIALRTPQYTGSTDRDVLVGMHLYRPGDHATSEPIMFTYRSSKYSSGKRARIDDLQAENFDHIPSTVNIEPLASITSNSWMDNVVDDIMVDNPSIPSSDYQQFCAPEVVKEWLDRMSNDATGQPGTDAVASEESSDRKTVQPFLEQISHVLKNLKLNNIKKTRKKIKEIFEEANSNDAK
jgi:hypothetical protein